MTGTDVSPDMRQLRLALVCEGGVSLAIYMHGLTKELHRLLRASRAFDHEYGGTPQSALDAVNPFVTDRTEYAYFEELRDLAVAGQDISVVVDIIAGTSAGGINGIFLANAIAGGGDLTILRDLWLRDGDIRELLNAPKLLGPWLQAVVAIGRSLRRRLHNVVFPLRGGRMSGWLYDAMDQVAGAADRTLVPLGGQLRLLVTSTDITGVDQVVASGAGGPSDRAIDHRQVMRFNFDNTGIPDGVPTAPVAGGLPDSTLGNRPIGDFSPGALAFAARATSSIQGAFPPVSVDSFVVELAGNGGARRVDPDRVIASFDTQRLDPVAARAAWYMDGGVLDNEPFDLVVTAIAESPAQTEVVRKIVFIDPHPGAPLVAWPDAPATRAPGPLRELWRAEVSAPSDEPLRRDLIELRKLNLRISQVGAIAEQQMADVAGALASVLDAAGLDTIADAAQADLGAIGRQANARASDALGSLYPTYCRLRLNEALTAVSDVVAQHLRFGDESDSASFVQAVLTAWAHHLPEWPSQDSSALVTMCNGIDVPYGRRQLRFVISGVNALYPVAGASPEAPARADLDAIKAAGWRLLAGLEAAHQGAIVPTEPLANAIDLVFGPAVLTPDVVLGDPAGWARRHADDLARLIDAYGMRLSAVLALARTGLWSALTANTARWLEADRESLLSRYVGFPVWDALIFPVTAWSRLPQYSPIGVTRWGPTDAIAVQAPEMPKLHGSSFIGFGAFLRADWRRSDYLWGRLDGVELVLRTLRDGALGRAFQASGSGADLRPGARCGSHLANALSAVLAEESDLAGVAAARTTVEAAITDLVGVPRQAQVPVSVAR